MLDRTNPRPQLAAVARGLGIHLDDPAWLEKTYAALYYWYFAPYRNCHATAASAKHDCSQRWRAFQCGELQHWLLRATDFYMREDADGARHSALTPPDELDELSRWLFYRAVKWFADQPALSKQMPVDASDLARGCAQYANDLLREDPQWQPPAFLIADG